jgi:uncharacterized OB-fold protein
MDTNTNQDGLLAVLMKPTADSRPFWEGCNAEQLLLQRCAACRHLFYYARRLCPACGGTELSWEASSGRGSVYSFSQVHVPFQGPEWASQLPYTVLLVDLDDGPRMLSRWLGAAGSEPAIGDRVRVTFPSVDGQKLPFFTADAPEPTCPS